MRRLKGDRGAVAIIVALMMIPILVCAALVLDIGWAYVQLAQLQNAADGAALAIAQDCASGRQKPCSKTASEGTARSFANATVWGFADATVRGEATITVTPDPPVDSVTVVAALKVDYVFDRITGVEDPSPAAHATAVWGAPVSGTSVLPIAFAYCAFSLQTGGSVPSSTAQTIQFPKTDDTDCTGAKNNEVPGGFGWVDADNKCTVKSTTVPGDILNTLSSHTGAGNLPCDRKFFQAQVGKTVLLPVFIRSTGSGTNAQYFVYAYAAFQFMGFDFRGSHNSISGRFMVFVEPSELFSYGVGAPNLYAQVVELTG